MSLFSLSDDEFEKLSFDQLKSLVKQERQKNKIVENEKKSKHQPTTAQQQSKPPPFIKKKKPKKVFTMDKYSIRHIALRVAYLGWDYRGLARQEDTEETIEGHLFAALEKTRLITSRKECGFSRSGRTDKGVSAFEQVLSLDVRSNCKKGLGIVKLPLNYNVESENDNDNNDDVLGVEKEMDYAKILNNVLPSDIRVTAWAPVELNFDARFSTLYRTYRYYFFQQDDMDLERMRDGARRFIGEHDFRNFCKMDMTKAISHVRTIVAFDIHQLESHKSTHASQRGKLCELRVRGFAFLWHQVRNMAAVLFLIAKRLEEPSVVTKMLDLQQCPAKPLYKLASDLPLVLEEAEYDGLQWQRRIESSVVASLQTTAKQIAYRLAIVDGFINSLSINKSNANNRNTDNNNDDNITSNDNDDEKNNNRNSNYVPLLKRLTERPFDEKLETKARKMSASASRKRKLSEANNNNNAQSPV